MTRTPSRFTIVPSTLTIAYQRPGVKAALPRKDESIVVANGLVTAPTNRKLGVRQTIFTLRNLGGARKWKRTQSSFTGPFTMAAARPPWVVLIAALSTIPCGGAAIVNGWTRIAGVALPVVATTCSL